MLCGVLTIPDIGEAAADLSAAIGRLEPPHFTLRCPHCCSDSRLYTAYYTDYADLLTDVKGTPGAAEALTPAEQHPEAAAP